MRMRHIVVCGLSSSTIFSTLTHKQHDLKKKKRLLKIIVCFDLLYKFCLTHFFHYEKIWARYDQKCILVSIYSTRYSCLVLMKLEFSRRIFEKYSNMKFHENPFRWSRVVQCGRTDGRTDRQTDLTKLTISFSNFAKAPNNNVY
jgi:hypothetical protein